MRGALVWLFVVLGLFLEVVLRLGHGYILMGGQGCVQASPTNGVHLGLQAWGIHDL